MYTHFGKPNQTKVRVRSPPLRPPNSSRKRGVAPDQGCIEKERFEEEIVQKGWSLIRVVLHHDCLLSDGLSSGWTFIRVVLHQVVSHQGGHSSCWSFIRWSLIRFFFHMDRPSSGWSFIGWSLIRVILHQVVYLGCWTSPPSSHTLSSSPSAVCL